MKIWSRCGQAGNHHMRLASSPVVTLHSRRSSRSLTSTSRSCWPSIALNGDNLESFFISCLVQASSGRRQKCKQRLNQLNAAATKRVTCVQPTWSYNRLPLLIREDIQTIGMPLTKRRLLEFLDFYDTTEKEEKDDKPDVHIKKGFTIIPHLDGFEAYRKRKSAVAKLDMHYQQTISKIERDIESMKKPIHNLPESTVLQESDISIEKVFQQYRSLPNERITFFDESSRQGLMELLSTAAKRNPQLTLKFLSVLDDLQRADYPIPPAMSNAAIHLVGKSFGRVTSRETEASLRRWILMESSLGVQGDIYTFNTLLDVAVKGEQYALAEMVLDEMSQRGIEPDRVTRIGMIYFYGVRGDGDGIRQAYRDFINKDMIVDTVVLNCVIASLLRAGEVQAAHHVYLRMKAFAANGGRKARRVSEKGAKTMQRLLRDADAKDLRLLQQLQDISPDTKTFLIFVEHHISNTGDLDRIAQYLNDMQSMGIAPTGKIFVDLFRGFCNYGGVDFTWWTTKKLEKVWQSFERLVEQEQSNIYWGKWMVIWMLRAYARCCGRDVALQKWSYIKSKWSQAEEHEQMMLGIVNHTVFKMAHNTQR